MKLVNGFSLEFCPDEVRGHTGHTALCHGDTPDNVMHPALSLDPDSHSGWSLSWENYLHFLSFFLPRYVIPKNLTGTSTVNIIIPVR